MIKKYYYQIKSNLSQEKNKEQSLPYISIKIFIFIYLF
jgi:hypothetical protein